MRRKQLSLLILALLASLLLPPSANAATKVGGNCTKINQKVQVGSQILKCTRLGNKKVWRRVSPTLPLPVATPLTKSLKPELPAITDLSTFLTIDNCRLKSSLDNHLGFPRDTRVIPTLGDHKAIALFLEFPDLPEEAKQRTEWEKNQIPTLEKYLKGMSYGRVNYKVVAYKPTVRISRSLASYNLDGPPDKPGSEPDQLVLDAIATVDNQIDFSEYEFINLVMASTDRMGYSGVIGFSYQVDGKKFHFTSLGPIKEYVDDDRKHAWLLHEVGHMMGLIHPWNHGPDPAWSVMGNGITPLPEFTGWERFVLGWFNENEVICADGVTPNKYVSKLVPLHARVDAPHLFVLRLDDHKALVIESRKTNPLGVLTPYQEGVISYIVDTTIGPNKGTLSLITNSRKLWWFPLGSFHESEEFDYKNIKVRVLRTDITGDTIEVTIS